MVVTLSKYDGGYYVLEIRGQGAYTRIAFMDADIALSDIMQRQVQEIILEVRTD